MKLTKNLTFIAGTAVLVSLASCDLDKGVSSESFSVKVSNLYIPSDPAEEVTFQHNCAYALNMDYSAGKMSVASADLKIDGKETSFTADNMPMKSYFGGVDKTWAFKNGQATLADGTLLTDMNGYLSTMVQYYEIASDVYEAYLTRPMLVMSYKLGDMTVKTFSPNTYFRGETVTTYPDRTGAMSEYKSTDAVYRVLFAEDMKTANVVIYNIKFASEMPNPLEVVVLENLDVSLSQSGYTITGTDVVPKMREGEGLTDVPERIFNSFKLYTSGNDLTTVKCEYVVSSVFHGSFEGFSVVRFTDPE